MVSELINWDSLATVIAVWGWSPVTITDRIPDDVNILSVGAVSILTLFSNTSKPKKYKLFSIRVRNSILSKSLLLLF